MRSNMQLLKTCKFLSMGLCCLVIGCFVHAQDFDDFDPNFTLQSIFGRLQTGVKSAIQCSTSKDDASKIKVSRLDTGQGTPFPKKSVQFLRKAISTKILHLPPEGGLHRFGAYQCKISKFLGGNKRVTVAEMTTLKLPPLSEADMDAEFPYIVSNVGDDVEMKVNVLKTYDLPIRWRHNSKAIVTAWNNETSVMISNVQTSNAGLYEVFYPGRRGESVHALIKLIVRACPAGFYGSACDAECPPCYNGGVCHDKWGVCICPAGFTGTNCQTACGGNLFGEQCQRLCTTAQNDTSVEDGCAFFMFCKPDPYGCTCAPGFKGPQCMDYCEKGWYGPDCRQVCHCAYGAKDCDRITGACQGGCSDGWSGASCEIENPDATSGPLLETTTMAYCPVGTYGPACEKRCHCVSGDGCHVVNGQCPSGCEDRWGGDSCSVCSDGYFGDNCEFQCHCDGGHAMCDTKGYCYSGCEAGWTGFSCQQECTDGRFGQNCASTCRCLSQSCDKITGNCNGDCQAGFMGENCQTMCPPDMYGVNCGEKCVCANGGYCNRVDGSCSCDRRWRGPICNQSEPQIIAATDEEVNAGQQTTISCTADAIPEPEMNIVSKDYPDESFEIRNLGNNQYQAAMKIKVQEVGIHNFTCSSKNDFGFDMRIITLSVIGTPQLVTAPNVLHVSKYAISVQWDAWKFGFDAGGKLGDKIEYLVVYRKKNENGWINHESWTTNTIADIDNLESYTDYEIAVQCRRLNKGGMGSPGPSVSIKTKCGDPLPNAVSTQFLPDEMTAKYVRLVWNEPLETMLKCKLIGYNLMYFPLDEVNTTGVNNLYIANLTNSVDVHGIQPNSLYVYRLYPVTEVGHSKYYAELTFRTTDLAPGPVAKLEYVALEEQGLLIEWKEPPGMHGLIKAYNITCELMDRGHCGRVVQDADLLGMNWLIATDTKAIISSLVPYSTYFITVAAQTASGEGESSSLAAMTGESAPESGPPNVRLSVVTPTSLEFHWDPIPCEAANGIIVEYEYTIAESASQLPLVSRIKRDSSEPSVMKKVIGLKTVVEELKPNVEYGFAVRGYTRVDTGPFSPFLFAKTKEGLSSGPRDLSIDAVTSNNVSLSWMAPVQPNGILSKYRISVKKFHTVISADNYTVTKPDDALTRQYSTITDLDAGTDYIFLVQAFNDAGWGNWSSEIRTRTMDGLPGAPAGVILVGNDDETIRISWEPPLSSNGKITHYVVTFKPVSSLDSKYITSDVTEQDIVVDGNTTRTTIGDLHPSTQYAINVQAQTSAGWGQPLSAIFWTNIQVDHISPSVNTLDFKATNETIPIIFSTHGKSKVEKYQIIVEYSRNQKPIEENLLSDFDTAVVKYKRPYYIAAELDPANMSDSGQHYFEVGDRQLWGGYLNVHLNPGHEYRIRIRTLIKKNQEFKSVLSQRKDESTVTLPSDKKAKEEKILILGFRTIPFILIVAGVLIGLFVLIFFCCIYIYRRKEKRKCKAIFFRQNSGLSDSMAWSVMLKTPKSETESKNEPSVCEGWKYSSVTDKSSLKRSKTYAKSCQGIPVHSLADYFHNSNAPIHLAEEFKQLVSGQTFPWTVARRSENSKKNRYGNILPYDNTRVVLEITVNDCATDYINASYVDGYRRPQEYIVTQGPLDCTVSDFWCMAWQEKSPVIVMLTDQVENGKQRCSKYWPDDSMTCGKIHVLNIFIEEHKDFIIRTLLMRKFDESNTHRVLQYQFTGWPDSAVPEHAYSLLKMMKHIRKDNPVLGGPMIVHCNAGAGRSGTFVVLDTLIQQAHEERRVDIFRTVNNARFQRINLVQTLDQYLFLHEALLEALLFEETAVPLDQISYHLQKMKDSSTLDTKALIRRQYQMMKFSQKKFEANSCSVALSEYNIFRNRDPMTVPTDVARIPLHPETNGSSLVEDYINAIYVDGYKTKNAYIVTQMPMHHTINDFWTLIYQTKPSIILMLNTMDDEEDSNIGQYWPTSDCKYGMFRVNATAVKDHDEMLVRIMTLKNSTESSEEPFEVIQIEWKMWDSFQQLPKNPSSVVNLLQTIRSFRQRSSGGPVIVHCMDGATKCGLFCASSYICDQIYSDQTFDAYQAMKSIRVNRPEFIPSMDQFIFCFELAKTCSDSMNEEVYSNMDSFPC